MQTRKLSEDEVIRLALRLSAEGKRKLIEKIRIDDRTEWEALRAYGCQRAQAVFAENDLDWNRMTQDDREAALMRILDEPSA
ncbi:MAG: hypothetical protein JXQ73_01220 [Phycisphaerae bacterium]|nr:hypothetical protein [Phycisphaerae bacterium]